MSNPYDGDPTDFSHETQVGFSTKPNDFFSYFVSKEDSETQEYIIVVYGDRAHETLLACRPYIRKQITARLGGMILVHLKQGVNLRDLRDILEPVGGTIGPNRRVELA